VILASGPEILSVRNPIRNEERKYIAGLDPIEAWDRRMMEELDIPLQSMSPTAAEAEAGPKVLSLAARAARAGVFANPPQAAPVAAHG
jgi:hypothetical protein